jgi:hypothetical protein
MAAVMDLSFSFLTWWEHMFVKPGSINLVMSLLQATLLEFSVMMEDLMVEYALNHARCIARW